VDCLVNILSYNGKESSGLSSSFKPQSSMTVNPTSVGKIKPLHIMICNIIVFSFKDSTKWPLQFIKVTVSVASTWSRSLKAYLEDSFTDRIWVDLPECYIFVQNIETAFPTPGIDPRTLFPLVAFSESAIDALNAHEGSSGTVEAQDHSELPTCILFNKVRISTRNPSA